jgi:penicillin-binding protein 2
MKKDKQQQFTRRALLLMLCKSFFIGVLGINFYRLQILSRDKYQLLSDKNRMRINILQAARGIITDRNGVVMATNAFIYNLSVDTNQELQPIVDELKKICDVLPDLSKANNKYYSHITLCKDLNWEQIAKIESNIKINSIIKINQSYKRVYPEGKLVGYITGYTGLLSKDEVSENDLKRNFLIGKNGLEMSFDEQLQGEHGVQKVEVNAFNRVVKEISLNASIEGNTLKSSIDLNLQKKIAEINENKRAIDLVMDVSNGEILAIYSTPGYDPNLFTDGIKTKDWNNLMNDPEKPMLNRGICSLYPPGSTFKMMTLLSILNTGISPDEVIYCSGEYKIGTRILHCWKRSGHGRVNAYRALQASCNIYFAAQSMKCGINSIVEVAREFGFGNKTGIELPFEASGLIPSKDWKLKKYNKPWTVGDTVNVSIGQGYTLATPIQIITMVARIASGKAIKPTIVMSDNDFPELNNIKHLQLIRDGMYNVMKNHHWEKLGIAGKTGTAQVISKRDAQGKHGDHSMFVGFAPYHAPKYAVLTIAENAGWGSETALPITKEIFRLLLK